MPLPWLLADVGGTNVRFALAQPLAAAPLLAESIRAYRVADFPSLASAAKYYLRETGKPGPRPECAVFALAGRVDRGNVQITNNTWSISASRLQKDLGLRYVRMANDFAALSRSLPLLTADDVVAIGVHPCARIDVMPATAANGRAEPQTFCVLGPGTGLGVAALAVRNGTAVDLQTEGGHVGFSPTTAEEMEILTRLMARFGRVSIERLICGSGLVNLHQALCEIAGVDANPLAPEEITRRAAQKSDAICERSVESFCAILGSFAGDVALTFGAWDGVYLAGGLLAPLQPWLGPGAFRRRFEDKGRFSQIMAKVPVALITHPQPGLLGAAGMAMMEAADSAQRNERVSFRP